MNSSGVVSFDLDDALADLVKLEPIEAQVSTIFSTSRAIS
jgi:hypothetical protein